MLCLITLLLTLYRRLNGLSEMCTDYVTTSRVRRLLATY